MKYIKENIDEPKFKKGDLVIANDLQIKQSLRDYIKNNIGEVIYVEPFKFNYLGFTSYVDVKYENVPINLGLSNKTPLLINYDVKLKSTDGVYHFKDNEIRLATDKEIDTYKRKKTIKNYSLGFINENNDNEPDGDYVIVKLKKDPTAIARVLEKHIGSILYKHNDNYQVKFDTTDWWIDRSDIVKFSKNKEDLEYLLKSRKYSLSYLTESVNSVDVMLFSAIIKLDSREIKDLLERGANINTKNSSNRTPLITLMLIQNATEHKILEIAKLLIENNADLDVQEFPDNFTRGETALIKSAKRGFYEIVKTLIEASANWNKFNEDREGFLDFLDVKKCVNELKEKYPEKYKLYITKKRSSSFGL